LFRTVLCDLLGIPHPILQGAMQGAGGPRLAAAVSEAGGLGVLPTFGGTEKQLRSDIEQTRKLTERPFGVNITPMGPAFTESRAKVAIELEVPIVTTGRGDPGTSIVARLKRAGIVVVPVVPSVLHALRVQEEGADAVVASGCEAGGHVGTVSTLPLVPQVVDAVSIPVVAAVQLGTRLICSVESEAAPGFKQRVLEAAETDTLVTEALTGKTVRTIATPGLREYEAARLAGADASRLDELKRSLRSATRSGRREDYPAVAGQISGMVRNVPPVREIIDGILAAAAAAARRLDVLASEAERES
jgi:enoyl-[acyl-carrier protein] reductase II